MSHVSSDSDDCVILPSAEECDQLCKKFAKATNSDTALAMYYLQDRQWNLERSLKDFFTDNPAKLRVYNPKGRDRLKLISWNIDGLDTNQFGQRINSVCSTIKKEMPDIIFLQELVPRAEKMIIQQLGHLYWVTSNKTSSEYYVAIMIHRCTLNESDKRTIKELQFPGTVMGRYLLSVRIHLFDLPVTLINTHLESTADFSEERKRQLKMCFDEINEAPPGDHVLFGGDLNLRDREIEKLPDKTYDLWEMTGSRPEAKYTWDATRNTNINIQYKARCRFDRLFMRKSKLSREYKTTEKTEMIPIYFELIGLEKVPRSQKFPSDHWGILSHFKFN